MKLNILLSLIKSIDIIKRKYKKVINKKDILYLILQFKISSYNV